MKKNKLLKIYELYMNQGLTLFQGYEQRLSFFTGLISAVIGGIAYCFLSISRFPSFFYVVPFGLIFLISISELAIWSTKRLYKQLLENITVLAKIEFDLGMTTEREKSDCIIRSMSSTKSGACRPLNPEHVVHQIRSMSSTF